MATFPKKLVYGSKRYTKIDDIKVAIPLHIIVDPKLKVFVPDCVETFTGSLCEKYQRSYLLMECLIQI